MIELVLAVQLAFTGEPTASFQEAQYGAGRWYGVPPDRYDPPPGIYGPPPYGGPPRRRDPYGPQMGPCIYYGECGGRGYGGPPRMPPFPRYEDDYD